MIPGAFILLMVTSVSAGIYFAWRCRRGWIERILIALVAPAIAFACWLSCVAMISGATSDWSSAKLAPIMAIARGYPLYENPDSGVLSGWVYGPIPAILFLPAALWTTPTPALLTAMLLNALIFFAPIVWIILMVARGAGKRRWLLALAVIGLFLTHVLTHVSLYLIMFVTSADAPAIGFAACSCTLLMSGRSGWHMTLAALTAVLAVWSKQTLAPFLIVAPIYFWIAGGWRLSFRYSAILTGAIAIVSSILIAVFGPLSNIWFHMVTLTSANPWHGNFDPSTPTPPMLVAWLHGSIELLRENWQAAAVLALVLIASGISRKSWFQLSRMRAWVANNSWSVLLLAAIVLAPGAVLGASIVGGYANHIGLTSYFLSAAAAAGIVMLVIHLGGSKVATAARCAILAAIIFRIGRLAMQPGSLRMTFDVLSHPWQNDEEKMFALLKDHPQLIYFPWHPLPALLANGTLYHFEWGAIDRDLAGIAVSPQQLASHIPSGAQFLAFKTDSPSTFMLKYFPQAVKQFNVQELPGFTLYTQAPDSPPAVAGARP